MKNQNSKRQAKLNDFLKTFSDNNKQIKKSMKMFGISNAQYRQAVRPAVRVSPDNCTKFTSFDLIGR